MAILAPLQLGKETQVLAISPTVAGSISKSLSVDAESVLISLFVQAVSGDVSVQVFTYGDALGSGDEKEVISFPTISAPTSELLLRKAASILQKIRVQVTYTGACELEVRARGVSSGQASVSIQGAGAFKTSQTDISTAQSLLPLSLNDRQGILILNNNVSGTEILYLADTLAKLSTSDKYPVYPGGNITINLSGGSEIFAEASSGTVDVRIVEAGT